MTNFYITFGSEHTMGGVSLRDRYVLVQAEDELAARLKIVASRYGRALVVDLFQGRIPCRDGRIRPDLVRDDPITGGNPMARNLSQFVNQAIWRLIEDLDDDEKYAEGVEGATVVERITKAVIRELPDDLKR
jgi:hypothetical protein